MVKKILLLFVFNICFITLHGQTDTTKKIFAILPQLKVTNEQIYQVLDSLILYNENCIYAIRNKPYYLKINLYKKGNDTVDIYVESWQYNSLSSLVERDFDNAYFYYKNNLVLVGISDVISIFFKKTDDLQELYYEDYYSYLAWHFHLPELMSLKYQYVNNVFIPVNKCLCTGLPYYYPVTRQGGILDTWESIASCYDTTVEELKSLNKKKGKKPLKSGDVIRVF
jgi:hypothetical protein